LMKNTKNNVPDILLDFNSLIESLLLNLPE
jgi:hypothetical protein